MLQTIEPNTNDYVQTMYASFADGKQAEQAAGALIDHGMLPGDISIVSTARHSEYIKGSDDFTAEGAPVPSVAAAVGDTIEIENGSAHVYTPEVAPVTAKIGISTTTPGDVALGAVEGAGVGLGVGTLAALACLIIPGFGLVLGAGALAVAVGGAAAATAAGAVAGGVYGYLRDLGVPIEMAERYSQAYSEGDTILAVTTPSNNVSAALADDILNKYHGNQITSYMGR